MEKEDCVFVIDAGKHKETRYSPSLHVSRRGLKRERYDAQRGIAALEEWYVPLSPSDNEMKLTGREAGSRRPTHGRGAAAQEGSSPLFLPSSSLSCH